MKTNLKHHFTLLSVGALTLTHAAIAQVGRNPVLSAEGAGGHGGGIVTQAGQAAEPADLRYQSVNFVLPSNYSKFDVAQYSGLAEAMGMVQEAIHHNFIALNCTNAYGPQTNCSVPDLSLLIDNPEFEFYLTPQLSGQDTLTVEQGWSYQPVAYTYAFKAISSDFRHTQIRRIVEIEPSGFIPLSPEFKALVIWHEILHHSSLQSHALISPFIQGVETYLRLKALQDQGKMTVSPEDLTKLKNFYSILSIRENENEESKFALSNMGGIVISDAKADQSTLEKIGNQNVIDLSSTLEFYGSDPITITNNTITQSHVRIFMKAPEYTGDYHPTYNQSTLSNNKISHSDIQLESTFNEFENNIIHTSVVKFSHRRNCFLDMRSQFQFNQNTVQNSNLKAYGQVLHSTFKDSDFELETSAGFLQNDYTVHACADASFDAVLATVITCTGKENHVEQLCDGAACNPLRKARRPLNLSMGSNNTITRVHLHPGAKSGAILLTDGNEVIDTVFANEIRAYTELHLKNSNLFIYHLDTPPTVGPTSITGLNMDAPTVWLSGMNGTSRDLHFNPRETLIRPEPLYARDWYNINLDSVNQVKTDLLKK